MIALVAVLAALSPSGPFTIAQAHRAAARYEHGIATVQSCHRTNPRVVDCTVITPVEIVLTNVQPAQFEWTDVVSRYGPCLTPLAKRTGPGSGTASGTVRSPRGCNHGPLAVATRLGSEQTIPLL